MIPYNLLSQNKHFQCPPLNLFKNVYLLSKHPFFFQVEESSIEQAAAALPRDNITPQGFKFQNSLASLNNPRNGVFWRL